MKRILGSTTWKISGIVILLYVFVFGLTRPLKPGVVHIEPSTANSGDTVTLQVHGYNTSFDDKEDIQSYLRIDSAHILTNAESNITSRKQADFTFTLPGAIPGSENTTRASLIIFDPSDGYIVTPMALLISNKERQDSLISGTAWNDQIAFREVEWTFQFPFRGILYETIRNTFFHVAIWFAMFFLLVVSLIYSIKYIRRPNLDADAVAAAFAYVAIGFGLIGIATGSVWAKNTWGAYWTNDPKLNMSAVALMIYIAYAVLRSSITDEDRRASIAAAYNIFAFVAMIPLIFIIPRLTSSLHPGNGGNPALGGEDLDNTLRLIFYPSIIGLILLGTWISTLFYRIRSIELKMVEKDLKRKTQ